MLIHYFSRCVWHISRRLGARIQKSDSVFNDTLIHYQPFDSSRIFQVLHYNYSTACSDQWQCVSYPIRKDGVFTPCQWCERLMFKVIRHG
ncbi:unnamed protein product [Periconia digitata]|uniref:Uncharacterized protein n=1 Tax=Periconia digitata TaxID=1303443 RepID=A0A9W4UDE1_9PLEO|nr:unnamed protein product [Periconia digitata]